MRGVEAPYRGRRATIVASAAYTREMTHYHAWLRSGRIMTMQTRIFTDRTAAHKWAARQRPASSDRVILACEVCPRMTRSKRVAPRWSVIAAERQRGTSEGESRTKESGEAA